MASPIVPSLIIRTEKQKIYAVSFIGPLEQLENDKEEVKSQIDAKETIFAEASVEYPINFTLNSLPVLSTNTVLASNGIFDDEEDDQVDSQDQILQTQKSSKLISRSSASSNIKHYGIVVGGIGGIVSIYNSETGRLIASSDKHGRQIISIIELPHVTIPRDQNQRTIPSNQKNIDEKALVFASQSRDGLILFWRLRKLLKNMRSQDDKSSEDDSKNILDSSNDHKQHRLVLERNKCAIYIGGDSFCKPSFLSLEIDNTPPDNIHHNQETSFNNTPSQSIDLMCGVGPVSGTILLFSISNFINDQSGSLWISSEEDVQNESKATEDTQSPEDNINITKASSPICTISYDHSKLGLCLSLNLFGGKRHKGIPLSLIASFEDGTILLWVLNEYKILEHSTLQKNSSTQDIIGKPHSIKDQSFPLLSCTLIERNHLMRTQNGIEKVEQKLESTVYDLIAVGSKNAIIHFEIAFGISSNSQTDSVEASSSQASAVLDEHHKFNRHQKLSYHSLDDIKIVLKHIETVPCVIEPTDSKTSGSSNANQPNSNKINPNDDVDESDVITPGIGHITIRDDGLIALSCWNHQVRLFLLNIDSLDTAPVLVPLSTLNYHTESVQCSDFVQKYREWDIGLQTSQVTAEKSPMMASVSSDQKIAIWNVY